MAYKDGFFKIIKSIEQNAELVCFIPNDVDRRELFPQACPVYRTVTEIFRPFFDLIEEEEESSSSSAENPVNSSCSESTNESSSHSCLICSKTYGSLSALGVHLNEHKK